MLSVCQESNQRASYWSDLEQIYTMFVTIWSQDRHWESRCPRHEDFYFVLFWDLDNLWWQFVYIQKLSNNSRTPVSDHPNCEELAVADEGRTACWKSFARRSADTSTFWRQCMASKFRLTIIEIHAVPTKSSFQNPELLSLCRNTEIRPLYQVVA